MILHLQAFLKHHIHNPNILLQNCIFVPQPATKMYKDAVALGYKPPTTLKGWAERCTSSRFEERDDITCMKKSVLDEFIKVYNDEFGENTRFAHERERTGEYVSPMHSN